MKTKGKYEIEKQKPHQHLRFCHRRRRRRFRIEDGDDDVEDCEWPLFLSFISSNRKKANTLTVHIASGQSVYEFTFLLEQSINSHHTHANRVYWNLFRKKAILVAQVDDTAQASFAKRIYAKDASNNCLQRTACAYTHCAPSEIGLFAALKIVLMGLITV